MADDFSALDATVEAGARIADEVIADDNAGQRESSLAWVVLVLAEERRQRGSFADIITVLGGALDGVASKLQGLQEELES